MRLRQSAASWWGAILEMPRRLKATITILLAVATALQGCSLRKSKEFQFDPDYSHYHGAATEN